MCVSQRGNNIRGDAISNKIVSDWTPLNNGGDASVVVKKKIAKGKIFVKGCHKAPTF